MLKSKKVLIALMLVVTLTNLAITLNSQKRQDSEPDASKNLERLEAIKNQFPIADYENAEPSDPDKRARRVTRNKGHNESRLGVKGGTDERAGWVAEVVVNTEWETKVPQIPADQSDVVLVGEVLDGHAFISSDKNGIYSEFNVRVEDTLKNTTSSAIVPGGLIITERDGGRVRYPSGRVMWFHIALQEMPAISRRYVFFLKKVDESSFLIITGYELRDGLVHPLDSGASQFGLYEGTNESHFLKLVRQAISTKQPKNTAKPK